MRPLRQRAVTVLCILVVIVAATLSAAILFLQWYALQACGNERGKNLDTSYTFMYDRYPVLRPWVDSLRHESALRDTFITTDDGTRLHALYLYADTATARTAIAVHGYTDNAVRMLHIAYLYHHDLHCNVLLPDLRYSGRSGGDHLQMGWKDRLDVLRWAAVADRLFAPADSLHTQMVIHGISMGGATTVCVSGEPLPDYIRCFVDDCGYTSVWDEFKSELSTQFGLPAFPLLHLADLATRLRYGWSFREASALRQIRKCTRPMLFIHGTEDTFVPTWMGDTLYAAHPGPKEYWHVPEVDHATAYLSDPEEYTKRIKKFVIPRLLPNFMPNLQSE